MLTIIREQGDHITRSKDPRLLPELLKDETCSFWLDLEDPTEEEFQLLEAVFAFHPLAIEDAFKPRQLPKVDEYDTFSFFVVDAVMLNRSALKREYRQRNPNVEAITACQISIFLGTHYLVTVHHDPVQLVRDVRDLCEQNRRLLSHGVDHLLYSLLDVVVDSYFPLLDELEDALDNLETEIVVSAVSMELDELFALKHELTRLRKRVTPLREVLQTLMSRDFPGIQDTTLPYLRDVDDHLFRIYETLDLYRDMASNLLDAYLSQKSNDLNVAMRKLSAVSLIFLPLTFLTGLFGMNFSREPWANTDPIAWVILMGIMAALSFLWFRYRRWL